MSKGQSFDRRQFNELLCSLENYFLNDPELKDKVSTSYLSHTEVYEEAIRKATVTLKKLKELQVQGRGGSGLYECVKRKQDQ